MKTKTNNLVVRNGWQSADFAHVVAYVSRNPGQTAIGDFEEMLGVKENLDSLCTLHYPTGEIAGVFLVDTYQNYWFDFDPEIDVEEFFRVTIPIAFRNSESRFDEPGLDTCVKAGSNRIAALEKVGFEPSGIQTKRYALDLDGWVNRWPTPEGLTCTTSQR